MLSSHLSGPVQVPVRPTNVIDGRAASSVRAVQAVAIEEHQVRYRGAVQRLIDAKKVLDGCPGAAFGLRVQSANADNARWFVSVTAVG
jgi:chloramphenicol 3-O-phosphotransferase